MKTTALIILLSIISITASAQNTENGGLYFHIVDEDETQAFNDFYNNNPGSTFNERGELINPNIVSPEVIILGVYDMDKQKNNDQGNPDFVAIRTGIRLDSSLIIDVKVDEHMMSGNPIVVFTLSPEGGDMFFNHTMRNVGRTMAIVFENRVRLIARILAPIREAVQIEGFDEEESNRIARLLRGE